MLVSKVGTSSSSLSPNSHTFHIGTSKIALDVLTGVASEYLLNVGRTIQFLSEKYGNKMSSEVGLQHASSCHHHPDCVAQEIILHTLFESGITRVDDLERYIQDDVVRYGGRLSELGKKLDNAYQEIVSPIRPCLPAFVRSKLGRRTKAVLSMMTLSLATRLRVKTTPS